MSLQIVCHKDAGRVRGTVEVPPTKLKPAARALAQLGYAVTYIYDNAQRRMVYTPETIGSLLREVDVLGDTEFTELAVLSLAALVARTGDPLVLTRDELARFAETDVNLVREIQENGDVVWRLEAGV